MRPNAYSCSTCRLLCVIIWYTFNFMKRVLTNAQVDMLLKLLNKDGRAADYMDKIQAEVKELPLSAADPAAMSFIAGQWSERIWKEVESREEDSGPGLSVRLLAPWLVAFARQGAIGSIRRCEVCARWMFAKRKDQRFCSNNCRHKPYEKKSKVKERHKAYNRYYYSMYQSPKAPKKKLSFEQWLEKAKGEHDA